MPTGVRYLFVTGGVMSGIGKGITAASIAKILQVRGSRVSVMKVDPYLNVDAGTMNPIIHGEVFVTEDGGEVDMDLGTYERFLDVNLTRDHNVTTGQIYTAVIAREREGDFLGQCVQIIPHVTDEIKSTIRRVGLRSGVEILIVEIGGTVGDIESLPYLEAARQIRLEEGHNNVLFAHVTLVPLLDVVGEQKTKPTQHSVQELRRIGVQPDLIIARSKAALMQGPKRKIALFCNVEEEAVFTAPDLQSIYQTPMELDSQGLGSLLIYRFGIGKKTPNWQPWSDAVERMVNAKEEVKIAMCGKYAELADSYVSVNEALRHAGASCKAMVEIDWIDTEQFEKDPSALKALGVCDGVLVPGGFGSRGIEGKIASIRYGRERDIPTLGICLGFQLQVVEFARSLGLEEANSTEIDPDTPHPVIDLMPEQATVNVKGGTMRLGGQEIRIEPGTLARALYGSGVAIERHRHRYEVNPSYIERIVKAGLVFSAKSSDGKRMEILELPGKYFFMGTQFHGEFKSRLGKPSPPYYGFVKACLDRKLGKPTVEQGGVIKPLSAVTVE